MSEAARAEQAKTAVKPIAMLSVLLLFACIFGLRSMYTQPIEAGGDAIKKWTYVVKFWHDETSTLENHHTMRWAVNLPGVATVMAFGSKPIVYYLLPIAAFSAGLVLICLIARRRLSLTSTFALALLVFLEPMMHRASTQFQPIAFGFAYLAASLWFCARLGETEAVHNVGAVCSFSILRLWCQGTVRVLHARRFAFRLEKWWTACDGDLDSNFCISVQRRGDHFQCNQRSGPTVGPAVRNTFNA